MSEPNTRPLASVSLWIVLSLLLVLNCQAKSFAGCFLGDQDYRAFHHGQFASQHAPSFAQVTDSRFAALADVSWVYEEGSFQPIKNPFQLPCSGPTCKSHPFAPSLTPISSTSELPRTPSDSVTCIIASPQTVESQYRFIGSNEWPSRSFVLEVNRPPEN